LPHAPAGRCMPHRIASCTSWQMHATSHCHMRLAPTLHPSVPRFIYRSLHSACMNACAAQGRTVRVSDGEKCRVETRCRKLRPCSPRLASPFHPRPTALQRVRPAQPCSATGICVAAAPSSQWPVNADCCSKLQCIRMCV
jgi:hypothetical protein